MKVDREVNKEIFSEIVSYRVLSDIGVIPLTDYLQGLFFQDFFSGTLFDSFSSVLRSRRFGLLCFAIEKIRFTLLCGREDSFCSALRSEICFFSRESRGDLISLTWILSLSCLPRASRT